MSHDPADIWSRLQAELRRRVPDATYESWLAPLRFGGLEGERLVLLAPAEVHAWLQQRFGPLLAVAARSALGETLVAEVELRTADDPRQQQRAAPSARTPADGAASLFEGDPSRLNPKFTFEQFVIGDTNRFAHAAALAVAELPAQAYNPLFIVGPPGVGKTHLLHSIGNYILAYGGGLTVRYTTVERFTNEFLAALHAKTIDAFKLRYRRNDVLLVDDVQFLEKKVKTEEELFHTFNALHETGSQLVITSDRPPADMDALHDRLRQRFESGLLVDIRSPDHATRLAVLRKRAHHDGVVLTDEGVLNLIAARVTDSVRALEAALIRVVAYGSLTDSPLTVELAETVLDRLHGRRLSSRSIGGGPPTVERIQELVAEAFALTREELLSPNRASRVAWPRQVAMYLAREHTRETFPSIGAKFGGRDHSTVVHACKRAADRISADPEAYDAVQAIARRLDDDSAGAPSDRSR